MNKVDPITLAVLRGAFEQIAEEMDTVLAALDTLSKTATLSVAELATTRSG